jgi:hypothetical protein
LTPRAIRAILPVEVPTMLLRSLCFLFTFFAVALAHAQAASQPAKVDYLKWAVDNWQAIAGFLIVVLPALITGLSKFPAAEGFAAGLRRFVAFLSVVTPKDSPGSLKPPLTPAEPPVEKKG